MTIYTRKGDRGETGLFASRLRVLKSSLIIRSIGAIDEANSYLGLIISLTKEVKIAAFLKSVQRDLFCLNSILAGAKLTFGKAKTQKIEREMDQLEKVLPVLKNFILPGGDILASHLHFARTLVRRAERQITSLAGKEKINPQILGYLNRLSDYLFVLARKVNADAKTKEEAWKR